MVHRIIYQGRKKVTDCVETLRCLSLEENVARVWVWGRVTLGAIRTSKKDWTRRSRVGWSWEQR